MKKWSVAIADDNEIMLQMLDHIVSSDEELQVVGKAGDGEELIEIIREKKPDVVLLDIIMPKLDGLTVMDRVNQDKDLKKPAFIVISAVSQEKMTEDVFDLGADYYILKPFDNETVVNRIKKVHARSQRSFTQTRALNAQKKQESQKEYMERNLETDVTNIIHEVGVPAHISTCGMRSSCPSQIWRCSIRSRRFCTRRLRSVIRRRRAVWSARSGMRLRWHGAEERWIRSTSCSDIP